MKTKAVSGIVLALFLFSILGTAFNLKLAAGQDAGYTVTVNAEAEGVALAVDIYWENDTQSDTNTTVFKLDHHSGELNLSAPLTWTAGDTLYEFYNWTINATTSYTDNNVTLNIAGDTMATAYYTVVLIYVDTDIKPGSDPNSINPKSNGMLPIAILGNGLDVTQIDPATININGVTLAQRAAKRKNKPPKLAFSYEDVNGDGILDMVVFFRVPDLRPQLLPGTTELTLTGSLADGTPISGTDSVRIVPQKT